LLMDKHGFFNSEPTAVKSQLNAKLTLQPGSWVVHLVVSTKRCLFCLEGVHEFGQRVLRVHEFTQTERQGLDLQVTEVATCAWALEEDFTLISQALLKLDQGTVSAVFRYFTDEAPAQLANWSQYRSERDWQKTLIRWLTQQLSSLDVLLDQVRVQEWLDSPSSADKCLIC